MVKNIKLKGSQQLNISKKVSLHTSAALILKWHLEDIANAAKSG